MVEDNVYEKYYIFFLKLLKYILQLNISFSVRTCKDVLGQRVLVKYAVVRFRISCLLDGCKMEGIVP